MKPNATARENHEIDGYFIGLELPTQHDIDISTDLKYIREPYRRQKNPRVVPLNVGAIVTKGFHRPCDAGQRWRVLGLRWRWSYGWEVTITRELTTELHCNSMYRCSAVCLCEVTP